MLRVEALMTRFAARPEEQIVLSSSGYTKPFLDALAGVLSSHFGIRTAVNAGTTKLAPGFTDRLYPGGDPGSAARRLAAANGELGRASSDGSVVVVVPHSLPSPPSAKPPSALSAAQLLLRDAAAADAASATTAGMRGLANTVAAGSKAAFGAHLLAFVMAKHDKTKEKAALAAATRAAGTITAKLESEGREALGLTFAPQVSLYVALLGDMARAWRLRGGYWPKMLVVPVAAMADCRQALRL